MKSSLLRILFSLFLLILFLSCVEPTSLKETEEPKHVYIFSVTCTPTSQEKITLKNNLPDNTSEDISGWTLGDRNDPTAYSIPNNTILENQEKITFNHTTLGFQINDSDETIYLKNESGSTIDIYSY